MAFKLTKSFENSVNNLTVKEAYNLAFDFEESYIPSLVWLMENPDSPLPFPGKIHLRNHDYIHILLGREKSSQDEAFVVGFTMGNSTKVKWIHLKIFRLFSQYLYPAPFNFSNSDLQAFDLGVSYGRKIKLKNLNEMDMCQYENLTVESARDILGIDAEEIRLLRKFESWLLPDTATSKELVSI
ncbi:hypothetical protein [Calothrix sp. PCC 6303]|uniref:hypothetical protein n=1 Tax=Calothrix sp. PCC 6303 TaxID=1170562 RepID=UPI0002A00E1D|nr:hypothetical protein [Calothrix sp. PCC 6303]AFY99843.1 hypothetical protein Cal6303_0777 [Calothrix sp. PCC 6303]